MSKEHDDAYFSEFNGTQLQMRNLDSRINGSPHYSFAPGAPVSAISCCLSGDYFLMGLTS
jgi:hypothetical protein